MTAARLGLGLIGIGRPWPVPGRRIPSESQTYDLLDAAIAQGVRFFDTAPAYGDSERRLGHYLSRLTPDERASLTVATKCGERWDSETGSHVTHAPEELAESVERSVSILGRIDLLQLHQASSDALQDGSIVDMLRQVQARYGIRHLGASVKTTEACELALHTGVFSYVQMPVNSSASETASWAKRNNRTITIIGNRPYASGRLLRDRPRALREAVAAVGVGVVLTGTTNPDHLRDTAAAWAAATNKPV